MGRVWWLVDPVSFLFFSLRLKLNYKVFILKISNWYGFCKKQRKEKKRKKWLPWHVVATLVCGSVMRTSLIVLKHVTCEWIVVPISPSFMWDSERSINAPGVLNNFPHNLTHKHKHNRLTSYKREREREIH